YKTTIRTRQLTYDLRFQVTTILIVIVNTGPFSPVPSNRTGTILPVNSSVNLWMCSDIACGCILRVFMRPETLQERTEVICVCFCREPNVAQRHAMIGRLSCLFLSGLFMIFHV